MPLFTDRRSRKMLVIPQEVLRIGRLRRKVKVWVMTAPLHEVGNGLRLRNCRLSYRPGRDYEAGDIREYIRKLRRHCKVNLIGYVWIAEIQKRGAVHYHVWELVRAGTRLPLPEAWWPWGYTHVKTAKDLNYVFMDMYKATQKRGYPKDIRIYGMYIRKEYRVGAWKWRNYPGWVQTEGELKHNGEVPERVNGGFSWGGDVVYSRIARYMGPHDLKGDGSGERVEDVTM